MIRKIINRILRLARYFGYTFSAKGKNISLKSNFKINESFTHI